jgi:hypothetical protein
MNIMMGRGLTVCGTEEAAQAGAGISATRVAVKYVEEKK